MWGGLLDGTGLGQPDQIPLIEAQAAAIDGLVMLAQQGRGMAVFDRRLGKTQGTGYGRYRPCRAVRQVESQSARKDMRILMNLLLDTHTLVWVRLTLVTRDRRFDKYDVRPLKA